MKLSQAAITLIFACCVGLSAGSNYVYSAYAPQLSSKLELTSTQTNLVGASGNVGVYLFGAFCGRFVDRKGPRPMLVFAGTSLFLGYLALQYIYSQGVDGIYSYTGISALCLAQFATGCGSSAALNSATNGVAKSFSPARRGFAMSMVLCGYGLSAFYYSMLSHTHPIAAAEDPTAAFLMSLAVGCGIAMFLGAFFIRIPPSSVAALSDTQGAYTVIATAEAEDPAPDSEYHRYGTHTVTGVGLVLQLDFWLLFLVIGISAGIGLMLINNIGTITLTLAPEGLTRREVTATQANLVSLLSFFNATGRIVIGFASDWFSHHAPLHLRVSRVWFFVPTTVLFLLSQLILSRTTDSYGFFGGLMFPTLVTGFAYGCLFGLMPVICLERFGIAYFSSNNGALSLSPGVFGNIANLLFGHIYDRHVGSPSPDTLKPLQQAAPTPSGHHAFEPIPSRFIRKSIIVSQEHKLYKHGLSHEETMSQLAAKDLTCSLGLECYLPAVRITIFMSIVAITCAIILAYRRTMRKEHS